MGEADHIGGREEEMLDGKVHEDVVGIVYIWWSTIWCKILACVIKMHLSVVNVYIVTSECYRINVLIEKNVRCCVRLYMLYKCIIERMCLN